MKKIIESTVKIRFQDCDPFNHLNNTRYLDYFLNAREDQIMAEYGINVFDNMTNSGLVWIVASNQICYLKPAGIMEAVTIDSQLIINSPRSIMVEMRMWDENKAKLKAFIWTNFMYFNLKTQRSAVHPDELASLFQAILLPVEQDNFEDRKAYLLKQKNS